MCQKKIKKPSLKAPNKPNWSSSSPHHPSRPGRPNAALKVAGNCFYSHHCLGKGNFLLRRQAMCIPPFENGETKENDCPVLATCGPYSKCGTPAIFSEVNCHLTFVVTPCMRMSPPKSCILLEPISEFIHKKTLRAVKSTPFLPRNRDSGRPQDSNSSGSQSSDDLAVKFPELFGIKLNDQEKRTVEEDTLEWVVSPPKNCIIMEPADEKLLEHTSGNDLGQHKDTTCDQQDDLSAVKKVDYEEDHAMGCKLDLYKNTPMMKEPRSNFRTGKQPGENTLRKELWTRFEAATTHGIRFNVAILQDTTTKKGFLDRLDETLE